MLHYAAQGGSEEAVERLLLEGGAEVDALDNEEKTPLHSACWEGGPSLRAIEVLVEKGGADVYLKDERGRGPLHYAAWTSETTVEMMEYLVNVAGCDVMAVSKDGRNALHFACGWAQEGVVGVLVGGGADVEAVNGNGRGVGWCIDKRAGGIEGDDEGTVGRLRELCGL